MFLVDNITVKSQIILVSQFQFHVAIDKLPWGLDTATKVAYKRLPSILMTALVTALAMLPITFNSDNAGREIMGPMASIIIGIWLHQRCEFVNYANGHVKIQKI